MGGRTTSSSLLLYIISQYLFFFFCTLHFSINGQSNDDDSTAHVVASPAALQEYSHTSAGQEAGSPKVVCEDVWGVPQTRD